MSRKHRTKIVSDDIEDATIATADIADSAVTSAKVSDKSIKTKDLDAMEHGNFVGVDQTGSYVQFGSAFSSAPDVVLTGIGGETLQLIGTPVAGSFQASATAGTVPGMYMAWGSR